MRPLRDLAACFEGGVPAVVATAAADGTPNVTYLSCVRLVDDERVALSNQFFSKTQRNLAENPRASVLVIDPTTYDEHRLTLRYERTERRGPVFERLREDVDNIAALSHMQDVFKLRAADVYRVLEVVQVETAATRREREEGVAPEPWAGWTEQTPAGVAAHDPERLAELVALLSRSPDLDALVSATVDGLARLLGYETSILLLLDETGRRLFTIASHGFADEGVGSEVEVGDGIVGLAAERCAPVRLGNLRQMAKYSQSVERAFREPEGVGPGREIPLPVLPDVQSRVAVPAMSFGQLVGVLVVESRLPVAFTEADETVLGVVASVVAGAVEGARSRAALERTASEPASAPGRPAAPTRRTTVRFFASDGSTFLDSDYLIKGVAGRILWSLLGQHERDGRIDFTNREVRLDPSLELPEVRDNLESRLILLKRRLEERDAPIRMEKTGRGRFRLLVDGELTLEAAGEA